MDRWFKYVEVEDSDGNPLPDTHPHPGPINNLDLLFIDENYLDLKLNGNPETMDRDFVDWEHMSLKIGM